MIFRKRLKQSSSWPSIQVISTQRSIYTDIYTHTHTPMDRHVAHSTYMHMCSEMCTLRGQANKHTHITICIDVYVYSVYIYLHPNTQACMHLHIYIYTHLFRHIFWDPHSSARTTQAGQEVSRGLHLTTGCKQIRSDNRITNSVVYNVGGMHTVLQRLRIRKGNYESGTHMRSVITN